MAPRSNKVLVVALAGLALVLLAVLLYVRSDALRDSKAPAEPTKVAASGDVLARAERLIQDASSKRKRALFDQAEELLRGALENHPRKDEVLASLGHLQLQRSSFISTLMGGRKVPASTMHLFARALKVNGKNVRALQGLALYHEMRGDLEQAVAADERVIAVDSDNLTAWQHKGKCLVKLKQDARAERTLKKTISMARKAGDLRVVVYTQEILGRIYMRQRKFDRAEKTLRSSVDTAEANNVTACPYAALGELYTAMGRGDRLLEVYKRAADMETQKSRMQCDAAFFCLQRGQYSEALKYVERALVLEDIPRYRKLRDAIRDEMKPRSPAEYQRIAILSFNRHDFHKARRYADRSVTADPGSKARVVQGYLKLLGKEYKEARALFEKAVKRAGGDAGAHVGLGHLGVSEKDYKVARRLFVPAVKVGDMLLARARGKAGFLGTYDLLTYRMACLGMGWVSANQNQHEAAISYFDRVLAHNAKDVFALLGKGNSLNALNRLDPAQRHLKKVLKLYPGNKYALAELALVAFNRGDDAGAERLFKAALKRDKTWRYTCPYEGLGLVYLRAGKIGKAKESFKKAIKINPNIEYKKFNGLAKIYIKEGKLARARELLRKSMANYPYDPEAKDLLEKIK